MDTLDYPMGSMISLFNPLDHAVTERLDILLVELPLFERYPSPSRSRLEFASSMYTSPIKREPLTWVSNCQDSVAFGNITGISVPVEFVPGCH